MSEEQNRLVGAVIKMSELPDEDKVNIRENSMQKCIRESDFQRNLW